MKVIVIFQVKISLERLVGYQESLVVIALKYTHALTTCGILCCYQNCRTQQQKKIFLQLLNIENSKNKNSLISYMLGMFKLGVESDRS